MTLFLGALVTLVLAASSGLSGVNDRPITPLSPPNGPERGVVEVREPECDVGNRRASLRPQGALPAPGQMPAGSTMADIAGRGRLVVGINQDTQLFSFRDENRRLQGFDVDIVRDIAEAIFGDREKVEFRPVDSGDRIRTARSEGIDLVIGTMTVNCLRREQVEFTSVYYEAGQRVLVNRDSTVTGLDDPKIGRVCTARGSTSLGTILTAPSKPFVVGVASWTDCLMLLQLAEVDAISTDDTLLASMAAQDPQTKIIGPRITEEPYGIAIKKDTPDLVRFVNAVLERRAQDGRWRASYQRWLTLLLSQPPAPPAPQYRD